jgi:hypothetical protein
MALLVLVALLDLRVVTGKGADRQPRDNQLLDLEYHFGN